MVEMAGASGSDGTNSNGIKYCRKCIWSQKTNGVKTADETKVAGSAMMFLFAFADVVLAFWALRLKHRRGEK